MKAPAHTTPLLIGAALVGAGLLLRNWEPEALRLPARPEGPHRDRGVRRLARQARGGVAFVIPSNLTKSIGRSLVFAGAGLVLVRLLDLVVAEGEELL